MSRIEALLSPGAAEELQAVPSGELKELREAIRRLSQGKVEAVPLLAGFSEDQWMAARSGRWMFYFKYLSPGEVPSAPEGSGILIAGIRELLDDYGPSGS